jgi:hypothetical protein
VGLQGIHLHERRGVMIQTISWSMKHAWVTVTVLGRSDKLKFCAGNEWYLR